MNQKPIQLVREEFVHDLSELIYKSKLPAFVKIDVLNDMSQGLSVVAEQEYAEAEAYWKEQEKKSKEKQRDETGSDEQEDLREEPEEFTGADETI